MTTAHPTDAVMCAHYQRVRDRLRTEATMYAALSASVIDHADAYGTFGPQLASIMRSAYADIAEKVAALADDAHGIALDYQAHADGTFVTLDPKVLL